MGKTSPFPVILSLALALLVEMPARGQDNPVEQFYSGIPRSTPFRFMDWLKSHPSQADRCVRNEINDFMNVVSNEAWPATALTRKKLDKGFQDFIQNLMTDTTPKATAAREKIALLVRRNYELSRGDHETSPLYSDSGGPVAKEIAALKGAAEAAVRESARAFGIGASNADALDINVDPISGVMTWYPKLTVDFKVRPPIGDNSVAKLDIEYRISNDAKGLVGGWYAEERTKINGAFVWDYAKDRLVDFCNKKANASAATVEPPEQPNASAAHN